MVSTFQHKSNAEPPNILLHYNAESIHDETQNLTELMCEQPQRKMLNGYNSQAKMEMVAQVGAVYNQPNFFGSTQSNH